MFVAYQINILYESKMDFDAKMKRGIEEINVKGNSHLESAMLYKILSVHCAALLLFPFNIILMSSFLFAAIVLCSLFRIREIEGQFLLS